MKKLGYREGDIFALPLRSGGYTLGVVARSPKRGKVLFGYFFPHFFKTLPNSEELPELRSQDAIRAIKFADLGLYNREWPVLSHLENFRREEWPMPKFLRKSEFHEYAWLIAYDEDDPNKEISQERCDRDLRGYEPDEFYFYGAVEIHLTKLLKPVG